MFSEIERERCRQALLTCFICRRVFPIDVEERNGRYMLILGQSIFTEDGFTCCHCLGEDLAGDDPEEKPAVSEAAERRAEIVQLLQDYEPMNIQDIAIAIKETDSIVTADIKRLIKAGKVREYDSRAQRKLYTVPGKRDIKSLILGILRKNHSGFTKAADICKCLSVTEEVAERGLKELKAEWKVDYFINYKGEEVGWQITEYKIKE